MDRGYQTRGKDSLRVVVASAAGLGLSPIAPGSFGTLLGLLFHISIILFLPAKTHLTCLVAVFTLVCIANNLLTPWAEEYWQGKDPKNFVLDEVAGYLLVPILFRHGQLWQVVFWGFLLFRIFDIVKVPPAKQIDKKMEGGWGILLDDLVSAGYAVSAMYFLRWVGPKIGASSWLLSS